MRLTITMLMLMSCLSISYAQNQINQQLKLELDSIYRVDQQYRKLLFSPENLHEKADSLQTIFQVSKDELPSRLIEAMMVSDSMNIQRVAEIIEDHGYPGKTLVGSPSNKAAFFIIHHSQFIDYFMPVVEEAARKEELPFRLYASMLDRSLLYQNKAQIYGSQSAGLEMINPETGEKELKMIIWPVKNPESVNERRKSAGFQQSIEEQAKTLGIKYRAFTLDEIRVIQNQ